MEIRIVREVMEENDERAEENRRHLRELGARMFNVMSSPGSGKTLLFEQLIPKLQKSGLKVGIIEGDVATANDAKRLAPLGAPVALITTETFGGACHLSAEMIASALGKLAPERPDVVLVENVGNLVCPAEFDIGADGNIVLVSVVEGEDKPLKYPMMFRTADLVCLSKVDIAEAVEADVASLEANVRQVNPQALVVRSSGKTGQGVDEVAAWVAGRCRGESEH